MITISEFVKAAGSQKAAGEILGFDQSFVSRLVSGQNTVRPEDAVRLRDNHGIDPASVLSPALASLLSSPSQTDGAAA